MTITVPAPTSSVTTANVTSGDQVFCDGRTATVITGNSPDYTNETVLWTQTGGPTSPAPVIVSPNSPTTSITGLDGSSTYVFTYTITNSVTSCSSSASVTISYVQSPTISLSIADPVLDCDETIAVISYSITGNGTVSWSIVSGPATATYPVIPTDYVNSNSSPATIDGLTGEGDYVFRFRVVPGTGPSCETAFEDITVTVSKTPTASNAGTNQLLACNIHETELAGNNPTIGTGHWTQVTGPNTAVIVDPSDNTTDINSLINGLYKFRWIITGGPSCPVAQDDMIVLVVNIAPTAADAGDDVTVCYGSPLILEGNSPALNEWGYWAVDPTAGITWSDSTQPNSAVYGLQASTTYTFLWTIENACSSNSNQMVATTSSIEGPTEADAGDDECYPSGTNKITLDANTPLIGDGLWTIKSKSPPTIQDPVFDDDTDPTTDVTFLDDGTYEFYWTISEGTCAESVDSVTITRSAPATTAVAGSDQEICGDSTRVSGNTPAIGTGLWTQVTGPGGAIIRTPDSPITDIVGLQDGVYNFKWTISNGVCATSKDSLDLYVSTPPTTAVAGPNQSLCGLTSTTLAGNAITSGTGLWSVVSAPNTPTFGDASLPTSSVSGLITGTYTLRWTSTGGPFCPPSYDEMEIDVVLSADAGDDQEHCDVTEVNLTGTQSSSGTWTQVGTTPNVATITTTSSNTATASGLIPGTYTFQYEIAAAGCSTTDQMTVEISSNVTTADAGDDQELCGVTTISLDGNTPATGTGTWSILSGPGGGSFSPDANTPDADYINAPTGTYLFVWTISNGICENGDQVRIENYTEPTVVDAGPNQTLVCDTLVTMAANTPNAGIGTWTTITKPAGAPDPTIVAPISPTTDIHNLVSGTYEFQWTITNGTCTAINDVVEIDMSTPPTLPEAGPDQELCAATQTTMAANTIADGTGVWSQDGATPNIAVITTPSDPTTTITGLITGTYKFVWTATLGLCVKTDTVEVVNYVAPTADAGTDQSLCNFDPVVLDA
ncbi:MAG: hypothetical protein B6D64_13020, partial [Bacteroidetes bacterium 4484_276]